MNNNEEKLFDIINALNKTGILNGLILIGSWCLFFYKNIFESFIPNIRTTDIDFYVPNAKSIKEIESTINSLKDINYDLVRDSFNNKSSFISPDGFELEFIAKLSRENLECVRLGNTGIYAESLSYVEIYSYNYIKINYHGIDINVASPSSYVLQKLIIHDKRNNKMEKDIESIKSVMPYLRASKKYKEELQSLYNSLPKKWRSKIDSTCKKTNINLWE